MLPNFLHIGSAKAASGWLWRMCQSHPEIYVPTNPDNVNFFTVHAHRGLAWYEKTYFANYAGEKICGEFSNSYVTYEPALERIARDLPGAKLTLTIRNPIDRAFLHWGHIHLKTKYKLDPANGVGIPLDRVTHHHGHQWFRMFCEPGMYAYLLRRLYRYFPKERVHVMVYDDLCADSGKFLADFYGFLGVDPSFRPPREKEDINAPPPTADPARWVSPELRAELREVFREDVSRLQDMLKRDFSHWQ